MLYQTPYTLSVVYQATLVLIDGRQVPVPGRPVERPEVRVLPFGAPGAPVPPGTEPANTSGSSEPASGRVEDPEPQQPAPEKAVAKTAKAPAKTVAKSPARVRKSAPRARQTPRQGDGSTEK
jgi:hypothetical protein